MRKAVRRLEQYTAEASFICQYKLETYKDIKNHKEKRIDDLKDLYNERNRLYYKRKRLADGGEKDAVTEEIIKVKQGRANLFSGVKY